MLIVTAVVTAIAMMIVIINDKDNLGTLRGDNDIYIYFVTYYL